MKIIFVLMAILLIFSCNKNAKENELELKNINEIVETVIKEDSLKILKNEKLQKLLCDSLQNIQIYIPTKNDASNLIPLPPPPPSSTSIERLINSKIKGEIFFSSKDSLCIINQNSNSKKIRIDENILKKINSTTTEKEILKANNEKEYNFYEISKPIFSLDSKRAYLELNHYCGHLCGSGKAIFLQKIDGKWKIMEQYQTWIS